MHFDLQKLEARDIYTLLTGVIVPRPIALVTTLDEAGLVNAAPFSYFNLLGTDPPIIALGPGDRPDGTPKDTARNIRARGEFVVNIVDEALAEPMNICAVPFPPGQSEPEAAQLELLDSVQIKPPRLAASPVSLECREHLTLHIGRNRVVLAQVLGVHAREDVVDALSLHVDATRLRAIGRLGGHGYARTGGGFEMPRPSLEDWNRRRVAARPLHASRGVKRAWSRSPGAAARRLFSAWGNLENSAAKAQKYLGRPKGSTRGGSSRGQQARRVSWPWAREVWNRPGVRQGQGEAWIWVALDGVGIGNQPSHY